MTQLFRTEAIDNKRERLWGEVVLTQRLSFYWITAVIVLVVAIIATYLIYGTYARRENVEGYLLPTKGLVKVYAIKAGQITDLHVKDGDRVESGDLLFTVSTKRTNEQSIDVDALILIKLKETREKVTSQIQNQKKLNIQELKQYSDQLAGFKVEVRQLGRLIRTQEEKYSVSEEHLQQIETLYAKNYLSKSDYINAKEHLIDIKLRLDETRQALNNKHIELKITKNELQKLPLTGALRVAEMEQQLFSVEQRILEVGGERVYTIRAPSAGRVSGIEANVGKQVRDKPLLTILPENAEFKAELFLPTRAIGFVRPGQTVLLRYRSFPYQRFGLYKGTVSNVGQVILSPNELTVPVALREAVYKVTVVPEKQEISAYGKTFELQAGMLLDASIILEGRTLGEWLLAPIYSLRGRI